MAQSTRSTLRGLVVLVLLSALTLLCSARTADAFAHLWQIKEVFSNADGTVQFIEMFDNFANEEFVQFSTLEADSDGTVKSFTIPNNKPAPSNGRHLLFATPGFNLLPGGVTPDFFLPDPVVNGPFFNPSATNFTISFSASSDSLSYTGATFPKNGVNSITDNTPHFAPTLVNGINSPTNYAGQVGSVNLSSPSPTGDYNGNHIVDGADYVVWRNTLTQAASPSGSGADGSNNGTIDDADYTFWRSKFGNAAGSGSSGGSAVPEPAAGALLVLLLASFATRFGRSRR